MQSLDGLKEFKTFKKTKDSNLEWLGKIPEHWKITKLKYLSKMIVPMRDKPKAFNGDIPWIRIEDFDGKHITGSKSDRKVSREVVNEMNLKVFPVGTVLCSCSCIMGATAIVKHPLISNQTFIGINPNDKRHSDFIFYYMKAMQEVLQAQSTGAIQQYLSRQEFENFPITIPPIEEMIEISNSLDYLTLKINQLTTRKQRLIELLQEKRQALIAQAVTKGLNPTISMKDSSVEWLGEIPNHWDVVKLKRIFQIVNGSTPKSTVAEYWGGDILWATPNDLGKIRGKYIENTERKITELGYKNSGTSIVPAGSIILSTRAPIGHIAIAENELCTNQGCKSLRIIGVQPTNSEYYYYLLFSAKFVLQSVGQGATFLELSNSNLGSINLPYFDMMEQEKIASFLNQETSKLDQLITKLMNQINLIEEYRQTLITDAVTGKIDVRGEGTDAN